MRIIQQDLTDRTHLLRLPPTTLFPITPYYCTPAVSYHLPRQTTNPRLSLLPNHHPKDLAVAQADLALDAVMKLQPSPARDALAHLAYKVVVRKH